MTTATAKPVNYTAEQTAKMVQDYTANPSQDTVEKLATEFGKTVRSIVAKLSREKVYKAKEYKTKAGTAPVKKDSLADKIGEALGLNENDIESLTKATKPALAAIANALKAAQDAAIVTEGEKLQTDAEIEANQTE